MPMRDRSTAEVAAALGVSAGTIRYHARSWRLPFDTTLGGHRRFDLDEVRAVITEVPDTTDLFAPTAFGEPLAATGARDRSLNSSAQVWLGATAGTDEDDDAELVPRSLDPFAGLTVAGEVRYPTTAHGVGANA